MVSSTIELSTMTVEDSYKGPRMKGNDREGYTLDLEFVQAMLQVRGCCRQPGKRAAAGYPCQCVLILVVELCVQWPMLLLTAYALALCIYCFGAALGPPLAHFSGDTYVTAYAI